MIAATSISFPSLVVMATSFRLALRANLSYKYPSRTLQINVLCNRNGTLQETTWSHVAACVPRKSVWNIEPCMGYLFLYFISLFFLFSYLFIYSFIYLSIHFFTYSIIYLIPAQTGNIIMYMWLNILLVLSVVNWPSKG